MTLAAERFNFKDRRDIWYSADIWIVVGAMNEADAHASTMCIMYIAK
jgi:hypothetical protein